MTSDSHTYVTSLTRALRLPRTRQCHQHYCGRRAERSIDKTWITPSSNKAGRYAPTQRPSEGCWCFHQHVHCAYSCVAASMRFHELRANDNVHNQCTSLLHCASGAPIAAMIRMNRTHDPITHYHYHCYVEISFVPGICYVKYRISRIVLL